MRRLLIAFLVLTAAACREKAPPQEAAIPTKAVVAGERLIDFRGRTGAFACLAPADWKTLEENAAGGPLAMFFGPSSGPGRGKASISISRYPDGVDRVKTPKDFWQAMKLAGQNPSPLESIQVGGRKAFAVHVETPQHPPEGWKVLYMNREDTVMIPFDDGFFEITHRAPSDSYRLTLPIFEAVVASFQPKR